MASFKRRYFKQSYPGFQRDYLHVWVEVKEDNFSCVLGIQGEVVYHWPIEEYHKAFNKIQIESYYCHHHDQPKDKQEFVEMSREEYFALIL